MLRRFLGLNHTPPPGAEATPATPAAEPTQPSAAADTETVRKIVAALDALPPDRARFLAGFAYVLSRTAQADLSIGDDETAEMERVVVEHGHIPDAQAVIVVQIAKTQSRMFGATENYLVTRQFREVATDEECLDLLRCCWLIGVADGTITAEESGELNAIAEQLGIEDLAVRSLRAEYAEQFAALRAMRQMRADGPSGT